MKKILKWVLKCPVLVLILAIWAVLTFLTWEEGKMPMAMEQNLVQNPVFAVLMNKQAELPELDSVDLGQNSNIPEIDIPDPDATDPDTDIQNPDAGNTGKKPDKSDAAGAKDDGAQEKGKNGKASGKTDSKTDKTGSKTDKTDSKTDKTGSKTDNTDSKTDEKDTETGKNETAGVTKFREHKKVKTESQYYSDPGVIALTTEYSYEKVNKDYFDDAVFIGDSRTVGMQDYSGLDNATFFAKTGMNVYEILDDNFIKEPSNGKDVSVTYMFKHYKYKKIYLMIGINELGTGNTGTFQKAYERVLQKFRKWQPEAVIYIQGIIPVSKKKALSDPIFNNININDKNVAIAQLADGKDIFYLDVSERLTDKNGFLKEDYTFDDVHMYAQHYQLWTDYLMEHAVVRK